MDWTKYNNEQLAQYLEMHTKESERILSRLQYARKEVSTQEEEYMKIKKRINNIQYELALRK